MAYISYDNLCRSQFYNNICAKDKVQHIKRNHLKLKVNDTYKKDEKITTNLKAVIDEDVTNKEYLDTKLAEITGHLL